MWESDVVNGISHKRTLGILFFRMENFSILPFYFTLLFYSSILPLLQKTRKKMFFLIGHSAEGKKAKIQTPFTSGNFVCETKEILKEWNKEWSFFLLWCAFFGVIDCLTEQRWRNKLPKIYSTACEIKLVCVGKFCWWDWYFSFDNVFRRKEKNVWKISKSNNEKKKTTLNQTFFPVRV